MQGVFWQSEGIEIFGSEGLLGAREQKSRRQEMCLKLLNFSFINFYTDSNLFAECSVKQSIRSSSDPVRSRARGKNNAWRRVWHLACVSGWVWDWKLTRKKNWKKKSHSQRLGNNISKWNSVYFFMTEKPKRNYYRFYMLSFHRLAYFPSSRFSKGQSIPGVASTPKIRI